MRFLGIIYKKFGAILKFLLEMIVNSINQFFKLNFKFLFLSKFIF